MLQLKVQHKTPLRKYKIRKREEKGKKIRTKRNDLFELDDKEILFKLPRLRKKYYNEIERGFSYTLS